MPMFGADFDVFSHAVQGGRNYMEDVVCVSVDDANENGLTFFGVFDGHGGSDAAHFAKEHLLGEIKQQDGFWSDDDDLVIKAIKNGFVSTHRLMTKAVDSWPKTITGLTSTAGTTASIVIIRNGKAYVAHVGDSTIVFGEKSTRRGDGKLSAHCITEDHKPESIKERTRIEQCGGEVVIKAGVSRVVWKRARHLRGPRRRHIITESIPFLAVARSLGDLWSYNGERDVYIVSPEPDVSVIELNAQKHRFIILASDGVWNMLSSSDAVDFVWRTSQRLSKCEGEAGVKKCGHQPASGLVQLALDRWIKRGMRADNISAIVVMFRGVDDDTSADLESNPKASTVNKSAFSHAVRRVCRRVAFSRRHLLGPAVVKTALCRLWRIRARHVTAKGTVSDGHCVPLPPGTPDCLETASAAENPQVQAGSSQKVFVELVKADTETTLMQKAARRRSYREACGDDSDDEDVRLTKRLRSDDGTGPSHSEIKMFKVPEDVRDDELLSDNGKSVISVRDNHTAVTNGSEDSMHDVESDVLREIVVKLGESPSAGRCCKRPLLIWSDSRRSRPDLGIRTRLQVERVCNG